ncbi:MAG TPA: FecR domain-containing protein [Steroidobacter sp.]|uniref:FecR domain-containing protein n=1 Tax=Steroidobacter sp. TaxID=1978227 RepID=UPI002EDAD3DB
MSDQPSTAQDPVERLIRAAGRRELPPAQAYERALYAATDVWQQKVRHRRRRTFLSLAACVTALAVGIGVAMRSLESPTTASEPVASVVRVIGSVQVRTADARDWTFVGEHSGPLSTGTVVQSASASSAALRMGRVSLRVASGTEVVLDSPSRLRLVRGTVYLDTGVTGAAGQMAVVTRAGTVTDVGTQFEVHYLESIYRVRVREGEVLLQRDDGVRQGVAGQEISIDASGEVSTASIRPDDPAWGWVQALATAPDIDQQPLTVLLAWVSRETGASIRYATPAVERKATTTILHGSIRHLTPFEALTVMLATTDLRHELLADGTIMIK